MNVDRESEMNLSRKELRLLLFHEFRFGRKASEVARNICSTMDELKLSVRTVQHGLRLVASNSMIHDTGRSLKMDVDVLKQLIKEDSRRTRRCLAERLGCSHTTVETHLSELGKTWKYRVLISHELSLHLFQLRLDTCMALMTSHRNYQYFHNLITGDEKCAICQPHEEASMGGNWIDRYSNAQKQPSSQKDYIKCLLRCKGNYPLGTSPEWVQHHC